MKKFTLTTTSFFIFVASFAQKADSTKIKDSIPKIDSVNIITLTDGQLSDIIYLMREADEKPSIVRAYIDLILRNTERKPKQTQTKK